MKGKLTKEFLNKLITKDCVKEGFIKLNPLRRGQRKLSEKGNSLLVFNTIKFTIDSNRDSIKITLIKDNIELIAYKQNITKINDGDSVTFNIMEGVMKITLE